MRVMLAMSGGVDSSVAAVLLREAGHEVVGVTMRLWGGESDSGCCSVADVEDARRVAQQLDIDHVVFNFGDDFETHVVEPYVRDHAAGVTPNPCIECNRHVKFDRLIERADLVGFDTVATGHHARVERCADGTFALRRGVDAAKDQSYVLHMLTQRELERVLLPVGHLTKDEVRAIAHRSGLRTAAKPDSQDVCFITDRGGREAFLGSRIPLRPGTVVDRSGASLGTVPAVELVTIGQRRGIGLPGGGPKRYVVDVDVDTATVVVGEPDDLLRSGLRAESVTWSNTPPRAGARVLVQCSAHGGATEARVTPFEAASDEGAADHARGLDVVHVEWVEPRAAVAPGQSVVFYDLADDRVIGGGVVGRPGG